MNKRERRIKSLGEVALRVENLAVMEQFYAEVIGLDVLKRLPHAVFFTIGPDYGGHTQVLVLFDRSSAPTYQGIRQATTPLDHFAFTIDLADYDHEKQRIETHGLQVVAKDQIGFSWRSLFIKDPEGNTVEFVCYDEQVP